MFLDDIAGVSWVWRGLRVGVAVDTFAALVALFSGAGEALLVRGLAMVMRNVLVRDEMDGQGS